MTFSIIMAQFPLCKTVLKSAGGGAFLKPLPKSDDSANRPSVRLEPSDGRFVSDRALAYVQ